MSVIQDGAEGNPAHAGEAYGDSGTRARMLDAAWELLDERGPGMTVADVASRAGASRQAAYLHFGGRSGLLVALVEHIDRRLGLAELAESVRDAPSGRVALERMVALHATHHEGIIGVARLLDATRHADPAVAAAWEDRMSRRRDAHVRIVQRIADEGELAEGWDVEAAGLLFYAMTLPRVWEELIVERGWSADRYRDHLTRLLTRALIARP